MNLLIERCGSADHPGWLELRRALWPHSDDVEHLAEMEAFVRQPERFAQFVAVSSGEAIGLSEVSLRRDYVNGANTSPVAFLEGLYVKPECRRMHVGHRLVQAAASWGQAAGCSEFCSDALLENKLSHMFHRALGFEESERVVFFRKDLAAAGAA